MASTSQGLFEAIEAGNVEVVRAILAEDPTLATARDAEGVSALLRARYRFDRGLIEAVHAHVPTLDVFEAATFGDVDRLTTLLEADPGLVVARSGDGFTPLHLAAFFGQEQAVALLVARGAEVDAHGTGWMTGTPLHSAASGAHRAAAEVLLTAGADPNARQAGGWTPLHSAAANGDGALVRSLLAHGADPDAVNEDGASVRDLAAVSGSDDAVAALGG
ncbi:MAG TPA: ankyrin repeat domain-containing protein [Actinomycetota bacterium]